MNFEKVTLHPEICDLEADGPQDVFFSSTNIYKNKIQILGGGFKYFLFSPLFGEDSHVH